MTRHDLILFLAILAFSVAAAFWIQRRLEPPTTIIIEPVQPWTIPSRFEPLYMEV